MAARDDDMTVCERIDAILKDRGMSRRKLAIKAGIAPSSFQSAMARNRGLSLDMLIPISNVLGISVVYLSLGFELDSPTYDDNFDGPEPQKLTTFDKITDLLIRLNEAGQQKVLERIEELLELPKYRSKWRCEEDSVLQDHD